GPRDRRARGGGPALPARAPARRVRAPPLRGALAGGDRAHPRHEPGHRQELAPSRRGAPARAPAESPRVRLFHGGWRRRTALLAARAVDERESRRALAHAETCAQCREALAGMRAALDLVAGDRLPDAEPPVPLGGLVARVQARLDEGPAPRPSPWRPVLAG